MLGVNHTESSSDEESEAGALLRHTSHALSEAERKELRRVFDSSFRCWCLGTIVFSFPVVLVSFCVNGIPWGLTCPKKAGSWLGCLLGMIVNSAALFFLGIFLLFPEEAMSSSSGSGSEGCSLVQCFGKDVWLFLWAGLLCQSTLLYVAIHRKHIDVIEPGPPHQVWGMHGAFTAQLLLQYSNLFKPQYSSIPPEIVTYVGKPHIEEVSTAMNKAYKRVGVAPVCVCILVLALVFITVLLWRVVNTAERRDFNIIDATVPLMLYAPFMISHLVFCRIADKKLKEINKSDVLVKKNVGWVMWRTFSTHSYSLWLVYRNPRAYRLRKCNGEQWWSMFSACTPSFRSLARTYLLINSRMYEEATTRVNTVVSARSLPSDLALQVLAFLIEGDTKKIVNAKRKGFRAVMV